MWKTPVESIFTFVLFSIFKKLFIFNWRIIVLQYCVGFCHTSTWISHRYTYVPFFLKGGHVFLFDMSHLLPHPSRLLQSPSLSSLSHEANSHWLSILHCSVCFQAFFLFLTTVNLTGSHYDGLDGNTQGQSRKEQSRRIYYLEFALAGLWPKTVK